MASWCSLAIVCREWNYVLAKVDQRKLRLHSSRVDKFEDIILQHSKGLRYIWLSIELPRYGCKTCDKYNYNSAGGTIFRRTATSLFSALQRRKPSTDDEGGLTLELSVFCPSDWEHWFKHFHFHNDADEDDPGPEPGRLKANWHDPYHGWDHGQLAQEPPESAIRRIFSHVNPYFPLLKEVLPQVHVVTKLVLRRQMRRTLDGYSIGVLLRALCCLEHLVLEPWRPWEVDYRSVHDTGTFLSQVFVPFHIPLRVLFIVATSIREVLTIQLMQAFTR